MKSSSMVHTFLQENSRIKGFRKQMKTHLLVACLSICTFFPLHATPLLSSKAIRIARQARAIIYNEKELDPKAEKHTSVDSQAQLEDAATSLEILFSDPSFRRLDTGDQVDIILLLSNAYELLGYWEKQEKLLSSYSKKREFHRYYITLQIELAKSHVIREQYPQAEKILAQLVGKSCARYPLEEKQKIAAILLMKEKKLLKGLAKADSLKKAGFFEEAIPHYQIILEAIKRNAFPFQASRIQRKQLKHKVIIALAECLINSKKNLECISLLYNEKWEIDTLEPKTASNLNQKRLLILGFANLGLERYQESYEAFQSLLALDGEVENSWRKEASLFSRLLEPIIKKDSEDYPERQLLITPEDWISSTDQTLSLWNILFLYACGEDEIAHQAIAALKKDLHLSSKRDFLEPLLEGFIAFKAQNFQRARKELLTALAHLKDKGASETYPFRLLSFHLISELYLSEALFYRLLQCESAYQRMLKSLEKIANECKLEDQQRRVADWHIKQCSQNRPDSLTSLTLFDEKETLSPSKPSFFELIISSMNQYALALKGDVDIDEAIFPLSKLRASFADQEGVAITTHCMIDIWIQTGQFHEAFQSIESIILENPSYSGAQKLICHTLAKTRDFHDIYSEERLKLISALFTKYPDTKAAFFTAMLDPYASQAFILSWENHLRENDIREEQKLWQNSLFHFARAVDLWKKGQKIYREAEVAKEPWSMKEKYQSSFAAYQEAIKEAEKSLIDQEMSSSETSSCIASLETQPIIIDLINLLDREMISHHFKVMARQEAAYNELHPSLIAATNIAQEHKRFLINKPVLSSHFEDLEEMMKISPIYCSAFSGDLEMAKKQLSSLIMQSQESITPETARAVVFLCELLRENGLCEEEKKLINRLDENSLKAKDNELSLQVATEKALMYRELRDYNRAMAYLAWVINDSFASSLRVRAMLVRADIYLEIDRTDLALRQLEAIASKGGEWARVAERKLEELAWR